MIDNPVKGHKADTLPFYLLEADESRILQFPLYSDFELESLRVNKIHPSYRPRESISTLFLNVRGAETLKKLRIRSIGSLLLTPFSLLLKQWNCGISTVELIQKEVKTRILKTREELPQSWDSLEIMLHQELPINEKGMNILKMRLGIDSTNCFTLQECGDKLRISREAVRQQVAKIKETINHPSSLRALAPFWSLAETFVKRNGIVTSDAISKHLKTTLKWEIKPSPHTIEKFFEFRDDLFQVQRNLICRRNCTCFECPEAYEIIKRVINNRNEVALKTIYTLYGEAIQNFCPDIHKFQPEIIDNLIKIHVKNFLLQDKDYIQRNKKIVNISELNQVQEMSMA